MALHKAQMGKNSEEITFNWSLHIKLTWILTIVSACLVMGVVGMSFLGLLVFATTAAGSLSETWARLPLETAIATFSVLPLGVLLVGLAAVTVIMRRRRRLFLNALVGYGVALALLFTVLALLSLTQTFPVAIVLYFLGAALGIWIALVASNPFARERYLQPAD